MIQKRVDRNGFDKKIFRRKYYYFSKDVKDFLLALGNYLAKTFHFGSFHANKAKSFFVFSLYKQRGKQGHRFIHSGMAALAAFGVVIAPVIAQEFPGSSIDPWEIPTTTSVLSASTVDPETSTLISEKVRDKIILYEVKEGDTVSSITQKFDISEDTVRWQNDLGPKDTIKSGEPLEILPITGISHKVKKGDTIYSIAKKYDIDAQPIVNFPFNTFTNDETFELAIGQTIFVPDGVMPKAVQTSPRIRQITPDAGTVVASGNFVWPAGGRITQRFVWYHKGIDIANKAAPGVLAADAGTVVAAGWPNGWGYGNRVLIDHGNGYQTLYAHLSSIYVVPGQRVNRGNVIGKMGTTGRSSGIHLHFEVTSNGGYINPLNVLK